jgi:hypothetical protein
VGHHLDVAFAANVRYDGVGKFFEILFCHERFHPFAFCLCKILAVGGDHFLIPVERLFLPTLARSIAIILSQLFVFQYNSNNFSLKLKFSTKKEVPQPTPLVGFYPTFYFGML